MAPRQEVTLKEWSESIGVPLNTVRGWAKLNPPGTADPFPERVRVVGVTGLWSLTELDRWRRRHPTYGNGRGRRR